MPAAAFALSIETPVVMMLVASLDPVEHRLCDQHRDFLFAADPELPAGLGCGRSGPYKPFASFLLIPSFRGDAKHRARNLEIPRCAIAHLRPGANAPSRNDGLWTAFLAMTTNRDPAARCARVVHESFGPKMEGAGNAGRAMRPQPRV